MDVDLPGLGTLINVGTIVVGSLLGMAVGHRLPQRTHAVVTDILGLVTLLVAALSAMAVTDAAFVAATGSGAPVLIVLGSLLIGGIAGSLLRIETRLEALAGTIQGWLGRRSDGARHRTPVSRHERVRFRHGEAVSRHERSCFRSGEAGVRQGGVQGGGERVAAGGTVQRQPQDTGIQPGDQFLFLRHDLPDWNEKACMLQPVCRRTEPAKGKRRQNKSVL